MDRYDSARLREWTYRELCDEVDRFERTEIFQDKDKVYKLTCLYKVAELYLLVTKNKRKCLEQGRPDYFLGKYDLAAFYGNNLLKENENLLKSMKVRIREVLLKSEMKFMKEMHEELFRKHKEDPFELPKSRRKYDN